MTMHGGLTIEPQEVAEMMQRGEKFLLLDCREPWEHQTAWIEGARLIPMRAIPNHLGQISKDQLVVVYCHVGMRSLEVAFLVETARRECAKPERRHRPLVGGD